MTSSTEDEGKAEARIEASLNFGEVITGDMDNGVNRLLTCHHDPNLAVAANANLFYKDCRLIIKSPSSPMY